MRVRRVSSLGVVVLWLMLALACGLSRAAAYGRTHNTQSRDVGLSYQDFDQSLGHGWRQLSDSGHYTEAAHLVDHYLSKHKALPEWQRVNLRFHAGQLYAFASDTRRALQRFRHALYVREPANSSVQWNTYVHATIAFLHHDRRKLVELRDQMATGPKVQGEVPNLDVVDRFIRFFDEPYRVAYSGKAIRPK